MCMYVSMYRCVSACVYCLHEVHNTEHCYVDIHTLHILICMQMYMMQYTQSDIYSCITIIIFLYFLPFNELLNFLPVVKVTPSE